MVIIRIYAVFEWKQNFSNDESVTYLSATGNQVRYANLANPDSAYLNNFTNSTTWKDCYVSNPDFCFQKIAAGLAQYDIHPPLYFWLMHLFVLLFGLHLYTGLILNLIITAFTFSALFKIADYIFKDYTKATMVCALWFLSPAVVQMDLEARHYQLFALFSVLLSYTALKVLADKKLSNRNIFFISLYSALGLLTHYYFTFVIGGIFILFLLRCRFSMLTKISLCFIAAYSVFISVFPEFITFIKNYLLLKGSVNHIHKFQSLMDKMKTQLYATLDFGAYGHLLKYIYLLILLFLASTLLYKIYKNKKSHLLLISTPISNTLFLLTWNVLFTVIFYMNNISPNQAVGEQYYSYIWPLFSILIVYSIHFLKIPSFIVTAYITILFFFCFFSIKNSAYLKCEIPMSWYAEANNADLLVIDSYDRCLLPRTLHFIDNNKNLFVGDAKKMKKVDSYNRIVLFYLINEDKENQYPILPGFKLIKKDKYPDSQNHFYYMESYQK